MAKAWPDESPRIGYWIFNYMPKWEAASKEVRTLASCFDRVFGTRTISLNLHGDKVALLGRNKHLPLPYSLMGLPWLNRTARAVQINHVFASPTERLLTPRLARLGNTMLTISKDNPRLDQFEKGVETLRALRFIVVESERHRDLLHQLGIEPERVRLIYPGVVTQPYVEPSPDPFSILFASSPMARHNLLSRGIHLMVRAAARLPQARFRLAWRGRPSPELKRLLDEARVTNVEVIAGYVPDMERMYDDAHAVILPALNESSLKPCPHSALHALAHGKPVLVSRPTSISDIVLRTGCGVVFEPTIDSLVAGVERLMQGYPSFQRHAHPTAERVFSRDSFVRRYRKLYDALLDPPR